MKRYSKISKWNFVLLMSFSLISGHVYAAECPKDAPKIEQLKDPKSPSGLNIEDVIKRQKACSNSGVTDDISEIIVRYIQQKKSIQEYKDLIAHKKDRIKSLKETAQGKKDLKEEKKIKASIEADKSKIKKLTKSTSEKKKSIKKVFPKADLNKLDQEISLL